MTPTIYFDTLRYDLKSYHPVVVNIPLLQLLLVEVQDEGQVIVKIKLRKKGKGTRIRSLQNYKQTVFLIYVHRYLHMHKHTVLYQMCELKQKTQKEMLLHQIGRNGKWSFVLSKQPSAVPEQPITQH